MSELDERRQAEIEFVLEEICTDLPHGGDYPSRKFIAEQLLLCAKSDKATLRELTYAGQRALVLLRRRSGSKTGWGWFAEATRHRSPPVRRF
jgi:hypothetical protein